VIQFGEAGGGRSKYQNCETISNYVTLEWDLIAMRRRHFLSFLGLNTALLSKFYDFCSWINEQFTITRLSLFGRYP
jgi:hypothetical protein